MASKTQRRKRKRQARGARVMGSMLHKEWPRLASMDEKKEEGEMLTVARPTGKTYSCDCTARGQEFQTIDEKVAVQHMTGHFRRKENYRMVITHLEEGAMVVDDVRGATFDDLGQPTTVTLEDLKRAVIEETEQPPLKSFHYPTIGVIRIMVHQDIRAKLNGFDPVAELKRLIEGYGTPPVRIHQGKQAWRGKNKVQDSVPTYRIVVDSDAYAKRRAGKGKGHSRSRRSAILKLAEALSGLPQDKLDALMRALQ
jgi:hypothetical protein